MSPSRADTHRFFDSPDDAVLSRNTPVKQVGRLSATIFIMLNYDCQSSVSIDLPLSKKWKIKLVLFI